MTSEIRRVRGENKPKFERIRRQIAEQQVAFVLTQIEAGIGFCKLAVSTSDPERRKQSIENAVTGLQTAVRFAPALAHDLRNDRIFQEKLALLKNLLHKLGREV